MVLVNEKRRVVRPIFSIAATYSAVALKQGQLFMVKGICPDAEKLFPFAFVHVNKEKRVILLVPKCNLLGVTHGLCTDLMGARDLFSVREDRRFTGGSNVGLATGDDWEILQEQVPHAAVENIYHQDLRQVLVLVYEDEVRRARGC